jgi:hypothetical protein
VAEALAGYGWPSSFVGLRCFHTPAVVAEDCRRIVETCVRIQAQVLLIEEFRLDLVPAEILTGLVDTLRRLCPGIRIAAVYLDAWDRRRWEILPAAAGHLDLVWSIFPSLELWRRPEYRGKMLYHPLPCGEPLALRPIARPRLSFVGGVDKENWARNLWMAALKAAEVDFQLVYTSIRSDDLPAMDSYRQFLSRLGRSGCALNFSTRADGVRTLTGRMFEGTWSGALVVQEQTDDLEYFFTPGESILSFQSFPELLEIARFIRREPEAAQALRRRAHAFMRERYSDDHFAAAFDHALFRGGVS